MSFLYHHQLRFLKSDWEIFYLALLNFQKFNFLLAFLEKFMCRYKKKTIESSPACRELSSKVDCPNFIAVISFELFIFWGKYNCLDLCLLFTVTWLGGTKHYHFLLQLLHCKIQQVNALLTKRKNLTKNKDKKLGFFSHHYS